MLNRKGFTLIELIIVIAIIGILAGTLYPNIAAYRDRYRIKEMQNNEYVVNKALKQYYAFLGHYPNCTYDTGDGKLDAAGVTTLSDELKVKTSVVIDTVRFDFFYVKDVNGVYRNDHVVLEYKP